MRHAAVVFGAAHCYYLADRLGQKVQVAVVDAAKFFPLSKEELAANSTKLDDLQSLRLLNFPALAPQQLPHLAAALEQIKGVAEFEADYRLFHAKLLLHQGRFAEVQEEFSQLAETSGDGVSAFDGQSRLREGGLVYAAVAKSKQGHLAEARQDFDAVLAALETTVATRQWVEQLKAELAIAEKAAAEPAKDRKAGSPLPPGPPGEG